jgi:hypothetical protein
MDRRRGVHRDRARAANGTPVPVRGAQQAVVGLVDVAGAFEEIPPAASRHRLERPKVELERGGDEPIDAKAPRVGAQAWRSCSADEEAIRRRNQRVGFVRVERGKVGEEARVEPKSEQLAERRRPWRRQSSPSGTVLTKRALET